MTPPLRRRAWLRSARWLGAAALAPLAGCGPLLPKPPPAPSLFALDDAAATVAARAAPSATAPTLIVGVPRAAPGFDSVRIVYLRQAHAPEAFAYSQWVAPPALMLAPLIAQAAERSGAFRAVLPAPTAANGELRLETELIRLQHEFTATPSRVRLTLRAVLVDTATRQVLASREFDAAVVAASEDPYGGVLAANAAVTTLLAELAAFCAQAAATLPAAR